MIYCLFFDSKVKGSDNQEKLVYQIIEDAGNKGTIHFYHLHIAFRVVLFFKKPLACIDEYLFKSCFLISKGIWSRDIRYKSNLPLTEINKILKNLESKKLIKAVKSVAVS